MRISDWSSDVCSSDLSIPTPLQSWVASQCEPSRRKRERRSPGQHICSEHNIGQPKAAEAAPKSAIIAKAGLAHNRPASTRHRRPDEPLSSTASIARPDTVDGTKNGRPTGEEKMV